MKKTILGVLMAVMLATSCFAQEIKPEGLFSLEGTLWEVCGIIFVSIPPFIIPNCGQNTEASLFGEEFGFYQGKIYSCINNFCTASQISSYTDLVVVSFAYAINIPFYNRLAQSRWNIFSAIMQPIGLGVYSVFAFVPRSCGKYGCSPPWFVFEIGIMFKSNDNWTPPEIQ